MRDKSINQPNIFKTTKNERCINATPTQSSLQIFFQFVLLFADGSMHFDASLCSFYFVVANHESKTKTEEKSKQHNKDKLNETDAKDSQVSLFGYTQYNDIVIYYYYWM